MKFEGFPRIAFRLWMGSFARSTSTSVRAGWALPRLLALVLLAPGCTVLLDAQKKQCETDQDCWDRGLDGATCVRELCQPAAAESDTEQRMSGIDLSMEPELAVPAETTAPSGARPAPSGTETLPPSRTGTATAGIGPQPSAAGTGALAAAGTGAAGAAGAAAGCSGAGCPECATGADCEARGMPGGRCIDSICWPAEAQCSTDDECVVMGPEYVGGRCVSSACRPNPRWRCEAAQSTSTTEQKELTVLVRDSLSLSPVQMVHIVACAKLDLTCASPVAEATTDAQGELHITVPASFAGYLQQTERMEYAPAMYFLPAVFPEDGVLQPFPLLTAGAIIDALATSLGARLEDDRGHMMLIAEDCTGDALAGVSFQSPQADDKSVQFYVRNLLPSTSEKQTAEIGNGGFLNFPRGTAVINVDRMQDKLHLTTVSIVVRPMFISVAYMRPDLRNPEVP
jgi:hypothetical protein